MGLGLILEGGGYFAFDFWGFDSYGKIVFLIFWMNFWVENSAAREIQSEGLRFSF